jgi:hypothetical protein
LQYATSAVLSASASLSLSAILSMTRGTFFVLWQIVY